MIDPKSVKEFLNAPRDDFSFVKKLSREELLSALHSIKPRPRTEGLMTHQLAGLLVGIACPTLAFWWGMGVGKSLTILRLLEFWAAAGELRKALILVPSQDAVYSWANEINTWKCPLPYVEMADNTSIDKAEQWLTFEHGLMLLAYPSLVAMTTAEEPELNKHGRPTGKMRWVAKRNAIEFLCRTLDAVVYDESTEAKNADTLTYRVCRALSKRVGIRYALAGRPFGRDPTDLWGQHYLIDHGESLGTTLGIFREAFFEKKPKKWGGRFAFDYTFNKQMEGTLHRLSQHRALRYSTEECVDLPPLSRIVKLMQFPPETLAYYDKIVQHLIAARGDHEQINNDFIRLRQLSSGFLGVANDEFGAKVSVQFDQNPKLDQLMELLDQMPVGRKAIIFHEFIKSGETISKRLTKEKRKHVWIWSGTRDRKAALNRFLTDPECEVAVINHMVGAYSLNLQVANYVIYYESPVGCIDRDQSERRAWRNGQKRRVMMYDLCMEGSVDQRILAFHKAGKDLFGSLVRDPKSALLRGFSASE